MRLPIALLTALSAASASAAAAFAADPVLVSRQSPGLGGAPGELDAEDVSLSRNGRLAAFYSESHNLSEHDEEGESEATGFDDVFVHDRASRETVLASPGTDYSYAPMLAAGGRFVVFVTAPGFHKPGTVHVRNLRSGALDTVGKRSTTIGYAYPQAPPAISADGRVVAYETRDGEARALMVFDRRTRRRRTIARADDGRFGGLSISLDGRVIAYTLHRGETNEADRATVYRYRRSTKRAARVASYLLPCCITSYGLYGTALSQDGRYLAYVGSLEEQRYAPVVFRFDARKRQRRVVSRAGKGPVNAHDPSIDASGRFVTFTSALEGGGSGVVVRDVRRSRMRVAAVGARGRLSADGRWIGFIDGDDTSQAWVVRRP